MKNLFIIILFTLLAASTSALDITASRLDSDQVVTAQPITTNSVTLVWHPSQEAASYRLYQWQGRNRWQLIDTPATTNSVVTLPPGGSYFYCIAVDSNGVESVPSNLLAIKL